MSGGAYPASAVAGMMHETKTTEPTNQQLRHKNLHNQQINNQQTNGQQNFQKQTRQIKQTKKKPKKTSAEQLFFNLMVDENKKAKDAWTIAGCDFEVGSKRYKSITQRARRALRAKQCAEETKKNEVKRLRQEKVLQHKFLSVQQHRHEANRCLDELAAAMKKIKKLEQRALELETQAATASSRYFI